MTHYSPQIATLNVAFEALSVLKDQACILTSAEIDAELQYERANRNRAVVIKLLNDYREKAELMESRIEKRKPLPFGSAQGAAQCAEKTHS